MPENRHELYLTAEFAGRFDQIEEATIAGDAQAARVYQELVRMMRDLGDGTEKGHHPLTDKSHKGGGDLRDCTASEFRCIRRRSWIIG